MTLIELLVVMVILAMVSALLVQGMGSALITYERVQRQQQQSMQPALAYRWLESTLSGAQAELDEPRHFTGSRHQLSGYSHQPLVGEPGQVMPFSWHLEQQEQQPLQLWYRQPNIEWLVFSWPAGTQGQFVYRSLEGAAVTHWPALPEDQTKPDGRLPGVLFLEVTPPEQPPQRWYIHLLGRTFPRNDYRDF